MADIYVSNEGLPSDKADGATWETAYEDLTDAMNNNNDSDTYHISGYHIGNFPLAAKCKGYNWIQDGGNSAELIIKGVSDNIFNFIFKNFSLIAGDRYSAVQYPPIFNDGLMYNIDTLDLYYNSGIDTKLYNCKLINITNIRVSESKGFYKNSVIGSSLNFPVFNDATILYNNLFYNCSITFNSDPTNLDYMYFLKCDMQFTGGNSADVPSVPRFLTKQEAIDAGVDEYLYSIEGKVETEWDSTVASNCFQNSIVDDNKNISHSDIFVDLYNFNLNLVPGCAPENAADDGSNMGANPSGGVHFDFPGDFHSYNNLDSNGDLVDPTQSAEAVSVVKSVNGGTPAIIKQLNISGFENFSSGNLIDAQPGLVYPAFVAGETLVEGYKYHNSASGEDITFNGRTILAGENFIAGTNDTFSDSNGNAKVYQISTEYNDRNIKSVKMKVSDVYTTESEFDNLPAYKFEYGTDVKANIDILGEIQAGNADKNYDPDFPSDVYRAYMQLIVEFSPENIPQ